MNEKKDARVSTDCPTSDTPGEWTRQKPISTIWSTLCHRTARLYALLSQSFLGRCAGGYRRVDALLGGKRCIGGDRRPPVSRRRLLMAEALRNNILSRILRWIMGGLYDLPVRFYGLFALLYGMMSGLFCALFYLFRNFMPLSVEPDLPYALVGVVMFLLSLPLLTSPYTLRSAVSRSRFGTLFLERYLCIPQKFEPDARRNLRILSGASAVLLAMGAAFAALFIHPLTLPLVCLGIVAGGLICTYPEAGALLVTAFLPVVWLFPAVIPGMMVLILLTWVGYGLSRLRLERTAQRDILGTAGILLDFLVLLVSIGGLWTGSGDMLFSLRLLCCLSMYFPIVHLLGTRAYIKRCLGGMGVVAVLATLANLFLQIGGDLTAYLPTAGGDLVEDMLLHVRTSMFAMDTAYRGTVCSLLTVVTFPLLCSMWLRARRLPARFAALALIGINICLIIVNGSVGTVVCTLAVTLLFFLLLDHRTPAVLVLLLPGTIGAMGWFWTWRGSIPMEALTSLPWMQADYERRMTHLWQSVKAHPIGVGFSTVDLNVGLFLEVLVALGWPGLLVLLLFLALLLQKGMTALGHTTTPRDRVLTVSLLCAVLGFLIYGMVHGFLAEPRVILTVTLLAGLLSALADVLFTETDVRRAESAESERSSDRVYRHL